MEIMRNRHLPRICRHCQAPMASGAGACWRCGVEWASEEQPPATLRLVAAPQPDPASDRVPVPVAQAVAVAAVTT